MMVLAPLLLFFELVYILLEDVVPSRESVFGVV